MILKLARRGDLRQQSLMQKNEIADILSEIAVLLELKGENPFKLRAYQSGARILESLDEDFGAVVEEGRLTEIKGIGKALAQKIETLYHTGKLEYYDNLKASVPEGLQNVHLRVTGLDRIAQLRVQKDYERRERKAYDPFMRPDGKIMRRRDMKDSGVPGRELKVTDGVVRSRGR